MNPLHAWLVYDRQGAERNASYIQMHKTIGHSMGIEFELKLTDSIPGDLSNEAKPDFALVRTIFPELSKRFEQHQIPVFNNSHIATVCNDKYKTWTYIKSHRPDIPMAESFFYKNKELSESLLKSHPEHVLKAVAGHGGTQVFKTEEPFSYIQEKLNGCDFILQPFIQGPGKDVRVYVIGDKIIAAVERTAKEGFRSNFSLGGHVSLRTLSREETQLVQEVISLFDFGLAGIDFILNEKNKFILSEIEDVVGARMLYQCMPDCHLLERYFTYIKEKILQ
ncbi:MAG: ATP-grasp domain-containing protein [Eubacterium sp.]|nr:ATP-grasp domain-containing protein [Eubacterium sp.]